MRKGSKGQGRKGGKGKRKGKEGKGKRKGEEGKGRNSVQLWFFLRKNPELHAQVKSSHCLKKCTSIKSTTQSLDTRPYYKSVNS